jgi:UDPglucose--hexose-1-phosphate uridylyltransferase
MLHKQELETAEGQHFILYGRERRTEPARIPVSRRQRGHERAHLRWHVLRGEWVAYDPSVLYVSNAAGALSHAAGSMSHAMGAPFAPIDHDLALPPGDYEVAVFDDISPGLSAGALEPPATIVETRSGKGASEIIAFAAGLRSSLGKLPLGRLELLLEVWADRYVCLGARPEIKYVFPFESRGAAASVSHAQVHAYPFVPPVAARELAILRAYHALHGRGLLEDQIRAEIGDGRRMLYLGEHVAAFVPVCARFPYEIWIAPKRPAPSLAALTSAERTDLARALKLALMKLDGLWECPVAYSMVFHQAPTDGALHPEAHLHVELYPAPPMAGHAWQRTSGSELGAGVFTASCLPEQKAAELRAIEVQLA